MPKASAAMPKTGWASFGNQSSEVRKLAVLACSAGTALEIRKIAIADDDDQHASRRRPGGQAPERRGLRADDAAGLRAAGRRRPAAATGCVAAGRSGRRVGGGPHVAGGTAGRSWRLAVACRCPSGARRARERAGLSPICALASARGLARRAVRRGRRPRRRPWSRSCLRQRGVAQVLEALWPLGAGGVVQEVLDQRRPCRARCPCCRRSRRSPGRSGRRPPSLVA